MNQTAVHSRRWLRGRVGSVCEVATDRPVFHLTFDDGPHPEVTPRILQVLEEFDAPATFYMLIQHAQRNPELVEETLRRGHEVGLHGRTHLRLSTAPWRSIVDEVHWARSELEEVSGRKVEFFRPPYGDHGIRSFALAATLGMKTILWSLDTYDWKGLRRGDSLPWIAGGMRPGGIGLIHDTPVGESMADERARGLVAKDDLTWKVLEEIRERGLQPVSLMELLVSGRDIRRFQPTT